MAKEILIYGGINVDSAAQFIIELNNSIDQDVEARVNTPGGTVAYTYGMIAKFAEHPKAKKVKVDGMAYSAGFYFCVNADYVECLDVSDFMMHRAALPAWIESNPEYFDDQMKAELNRMNAQFEKSVSNKLDIEVLQEIMDSKPELKGAKFKDIFSLESRIDVFLTPKEAKKIGLVNKIISVTPEKREQIKAQMHLMAAEYLGSPQIVKEVQTPKTNITMDLLTLKASHPAVYAAAVAEGIAEEKDRVQAWLEFNDIDAKSVVDGIASGNPLKQKDMAEFTRKAMGKEFIAAAAAEATPAVSLPEAGAANAAAPTADEKKKAADIEAFRAAMNAELKTKIGATI